MNRLRALLPAPTVRLRLTLAYGGLFLASGIALLTLTYFLARNSYSGKFFITAGQVTAVQVKGAPAVGLATPDQLIASAESQRAAALHKLLIDLGIALTWTAVASIWLGWLVAGRALRPLRTITNAARQISASDLHRRLALDGPQDELKELGDTFDGLLGRLEATFDAQQQFVANASHELRTPLTLERTLLEVALSDPDATADSLRRVCEQVLAVGEQQERLIEALLTLSRSQRGLEQHEPVDLAGIAHAAATAVDHDGLKLDLRLEPAHTVGDPRLVERLTANLIGNAVLHNVDDGFVLVATETRNGHAVLTVENSGPVISPGEVPRLYRPFQRLDIARVAGRGGLGLGLSIVDAVAKAHDADVTTRARETGGLEIEVAFPNA